MYKIENIDNVRKLFESITIPIIGIGVTAFNRLGPETIMNNYRIACLLFTQDVELIEENIQVFSLDRIEKTSPYVRKNSESVMKNKHVIDYLNSFNQKPALFFYRVSSKIEKICNENNWKIIGMPRSKINIEDKIIFRKILEECYIPPIPGEIALLNDITYEEAERKYGSKIVIQLPKESGGKGTFFVNSSQDFDLVKSKILCRFENPEIIIMKFLKGSSPSLTGCVTKFGVMFTNLQYQILSDPFCVSSTKGNGTFCGHDWTSAGFFSPRIKKQAYDYTKKIGKYLMKMGYKGIFGLDMVIDEENQQIYITECNPRLLGSFPTLTMIQIENSEIPLIVFHILEFLNIDYDIDFDIVNKSWKKPKKGAQIILHNFYDTYIEITEILKPGVYEFNNKLIYKRPGYEIKDLKNVDEFIITDGLPFKNTRLKPHARIARILTLHSIVDRNTNKLNEWALKILKQIHEDLKIKKQTININ